MENKKVNEFPHWGNAHWAFTLVLSLFVLSFICFYAHINYAHTTGNQFLSVAATLASIVLAVVAIIIALAQIIMAGQQSNQFDGRIGELRSAIDRMSPLPASVARLEDLVDEVKQARLEISDLGGKISSVAEAQQTSVQPAATPEVGQRSADPKTNAIRFLLSNNIVAFGIALGAVCAAHGKAIGMKDIENDVLSPIVKKVEYPLSADYYKLLILTAAYFAQAAGLATFGDGGPVSVDIELRRAVSTSLGARIEGLGDSEARATFRKFVSAVKEAIPLE